AERNPRELLETILTKAREITKSDAGSLYLVDEAPDGTRELRFALAQNDSVPVSFRATRLPLTSESVAGHVALTGQILNLADAYAPPSAAPFTINRSFDEEDGYRTKSMLVVPMRTPQGETIGALQLINCKPDGALVLRSPEETERVVRPFDARHEKLAGSLASQAAVALANSRLYEAIRQLFEGFVQAAVTAIESRDPSTSGHSFRVANLTVGLASVVDQASAGPFGGTRFSTDEMMELRYAALLHDFGKVGVREQVLVKAKKLYPGELDRIRQRVELVKRGLELRYAGKKIQFLAQIPWTKEFRRIPEMARAHHEKLDGSGYPYGVKANEIPLQSRIMTIADIYDALTAGDRPYKGALPVAAALDILGAERREGRLDGALLDLFVDARVYERADVAPILQEEDRRRSNR